MHNDPFAALRAALNSSNGVLDSAEIRPDFDRDLRTGIPEVILARGKSDSQVLDLSARFLERRGRALISRAKPRLQSALRAEFSNDVTEVHEASRFVVVHHPGQTPTPSGGRVALITAGTSDLPIAEEAAIIAAEMGCETRVVADVGVAGLHRLIHPLEAVAEWGPDAIIVAAGMDGALPSVVAGLVDVPVIGLPTSRGYGAGGKGIAALMSMLQTCVPGLTVVNVNNGIGAGASAARIANRAAIGRDLAFREAR